MRLAFLGLGVMGGPMAGHLVAAGHEVSVYNRSADRAREWCGRHGGVRVDDPCSAVAGAEAVLCCLGDDPDVRSVLIDGGLIDAPLSQAPLPGASAPNTSPSLVTKAKGLFSSLPVLRSVGRI